MEVEPQHLVERVEGNVKNAHGIAAGSRDVAAGGVDEYVDAAPRGCHSRARMTHLLPIEHVGDDTDRVRAIARDSFHFSFYCAGASAQYGDARPRTGQPVRDATAEHPVATGDDGNTSADIEEGR